MKKIKLGQELEVPETHKKELREMQSHTNANFNTVNDLSLLVTNRKNRMWEIIKQVLPETEEYNCQYNAKTDTVK